MREQTDHHDAELLLRLYDLRREERLREAREWFMREMKMESAQDFAARVPRGSRSGVTRVARRCARELNPNS
jgi:hypothetical protein